MAKGWCDLKRKRDTKIEKFFRQKYNKTRMYNYRYKNTYL